MSALLTYSKADLESQNGYWIRKEICKQPIIWHEVGVQIEAKRTDLSDWLLPILTQQNLRIILTGRGNSTYVGEAIVPYLSKKTGRLFEAIRTTDIASNVSQYLLQDTPMLVIFKSMQINETPDNPRPTEEVNRVVQRGNLSSFFNTK